MTRRKKRLRELPPTRHWVVAVYDDAGQLECTVWDDESLPVVIDITEQAKRMIFAQNYIVTLNPGTRLVVGPSESVDFPTA